MTTTAIITKDAFKTYFARDFAFGENEARVMDADIDKAIAESTIQFNPGLWGGQDESAMAFQYLTAHTLAVNLRNAGKKSGLRSSAAYPVTQKSAGPLSVGYAVPQRYAESPVLAPYLQTGYGQKYLQMIAPYLVGNVVCIEGGTTP